MSNVPPSLSAIIAAQKPAVAPVAPPAPVGRSFWVGYPTGAIQKTEVEVRALAADPAFQVPVTVVGGDNTWTSVDALGLRPVVPPPAPVVPTLPASPTLPVAPPTPVAPVAPAAPVPPVAPPVTAAPVNYPPPSNAVQQAPSALPANIATAEGALAMRDKLLARRDASMPSAASVVAAVQDEGGGSHKHPFATLKEGNWGTSEFVEKAPGGTLVPNGNRDYHAVYIAHRVGATLWKGSGNAAKGAGTGPLGKFVLGTDDPASTQHLQMVDRLTRYSRNVQMTGSDAKVVFDDIGRMTPEVQTLAWVTDGQWAGFVILVVPSYNSLEMQLASCRKAEVDELTFQTVCFHIATKTEENKGAKKDLAALIAAKAPQADIDKCEKRCTWVTNYVELNKVSDPRAAHMKASFDALMANEAASIEMMNQVVEFFQGGDFSGGLNHDQIIDLFEKYSQKPEPRRGGKK